jgi:hypothetical protein
MPAPAGGDFSLVSARANFASGNPVTAFSPERPRPVTGFLYYWNSAVLAGTSGGHSALIDVLARPDPSVPWVVLITVTATHSLSGRVVITGFSNYYTTQISSAFSANGSAPSVTTYLDL